MVSPSGPVPVPLASPSLVPLLDLDLSFGCFGTVAGTNVKGAGPLVDGDCSEGDLYAGIASAALFDGEIFRSVSAPLTYLGK